MMRSFARQVLIDIISIEPQKPGILHWAKQIAGIAGLDVHIKLDPEFEILYPIEDRRNFLEAEKKHRPKVHDLALRWSKRNPEEISLKIAQIEQEALSTDTKWPRWTPTLCYDLAGIVVSPVLWIGAIIDTNCTGDLIMPFLQKSAEINEDGWSDLILKCLDREIYRWVAISIVITLRHPPEDLLTRILDRLPGYDQMVMTHCLRGEVSEDVLKRLLLHQDTQITSAAAHGEWYLNNQNGCRTSLIREWRSAVVRSRDDYFVSTVLPGDSDLSFNWIINLLQEEKPEIYKYERATRAAASSLDRESKTRVLDIIPTRWEYSDFNILFDW